MRLYMMIGLPGSGKSTFAKTLPGFIHSSDGLREKHPDLTENEIWDLMFKNTQAALKAKADVVYDATNLSRKRRQNVLNMAKKLGTKTIAVLMLTPIEDCIKNNLLRDNPVPEEEILRMAKTFNVPTIPEFDDIKVVQYTIGDDDVELDFSQDNGYHAFSLLRHMQLTEYYLESNNEVLKEAAKYHDTGKAFTKSFINAKGEPSKEAHYYGHENYGTLWYLTTRPVGEFEMEVAKYINYHMRPFVWEHSEKAKQKDIELLGEDVVKNLELLHAADLKASK